MRTYLAIARATWHEYTAYRLTFILEVAGTLIAMLGAIALWQSVFALSGRTAVGVYTARDMTAYLLIAGLINAFLWLTGQADEINDDINHGRISVWLHRPVNVLAYWLTRDAVRKGMTLLIGGGLLLLLLPFVPVSFIVPSPAHLLLAVLAVICAGILHFLLFSLFAVLAFWFEQTWGERFLLRVVMEIAAGSLIPLSLFPAFWQHVFAWMPFRFFVDFPVNLFLGKLTPHVVGTSFALMTLWILGAAAALLLLWRKGLRRYAAEGA